MFARGATDFLKLASVKFEPLRSHPDRSVSSKLDMLKFDLNILLPLKSAPLKCTAIRSRFSRSSPARSYPVRSPVAAARSHYCLRGRCFISASLLCPPAAMLREKKPADSQFSLMADQPCGECAPGGFPGFRRRIFLPAFSC